MFSPQSSQQTVLFDEPPGSQFGARYVLQVSHPACAAKDRTEASFLLHDIFLQQKEGLVSGAHTAARDHAWKRLQLEVAWLPAQTIPLDLFEGPEGLLAPHDLLFLSAAYLGTAVEVCLQLFEAGAEHAVQHSLGPAW